MATTTKLLQLRPIPKPKPTTFTHFYSSASSSNDPPPPPSEPNNEPPPPPPTPKPFSFSSIANTIPQNPSSNSSSLDSIRKNLAEFRRRTVGPTHSSSPPPPPTPSFQELYHRNVNNNTERPPPSGKIDFNALRQNIQKFKNNNNNSNMSNNSMNENNGGRMFDSLSLSRLKDSLKLRPNMENNKGGSGGMVIGGSETNLPISIFGKELMRDKERFNSEGNRTAGDFVRFYTHGDLGEKLKKLRPGKKEEFSLKELNERLMKLREIDEEEIGSKPGGSVFQHLKDSLYVLHEKENVKKNIIQRLDVLGQLGGTPSFMLHPPKEQLVEKYFHPDNMSSEEKMKLELQKVRDEYKMSESDCGSARVQVAQLTTKIKHLSTVLHKKDKHSRKGLQAMVVKRKKLLKYLRRTDWDSYCLVLSKLGLRDNPDYKF